MTSDRLAAKDEYEEGADDALGGSARNKAIAEYKTASKASSTPFVAERKCHVQNQTFALCAWVTSTMS